jgi:hypothetical protein
VHNVPFPETGSRYFAKSEHGKFVPGGPGPGRTDMYNFGTRDARAAMSEETWDVLIKGLDASPIPRGAWRTPTGYQVLPMNNIPFRSALE